VTRRGEANASPLPCRRGKPLSEITDGSGAYEEAVATLRGMHPTLRFRLRKAGICGIL